MPVEICVLGKSSSPDGWQTTTLMRDGDRYYTETYWGSEFGDDVTREDITTEEADRYIQRFVVDGEKAPVYLPAGEF